ncbi:MAG: sugar nucleotide-binding protein [Planctomycetes bacterium]|nr:sugar nucleotide-binding protein [Planctomycetota bacterium]MBI3457042.1 sugar nucleotide-binding protein [Candidatus Rokubacteria bacterium]
MGLVGTVLVLGASSFVGRHLLARLGDRAIGTYCRSALAGAAYYDALTMRVADLVRDRPRPSHAVILLGDTDPESCAADVERSTALNVTSIKRLAGELSELGIKPVFISSEYVFDGTRGQYVEEDSVNPILTYGRQKVEVERFLAEATDDHVIVRLAKVVGSQPCDGTLFTAWLERLGRESIITCAIDQTFSPVYIDDVVEGILRLIDQDRRGLYHLAGPCPYRRIQLLEMLVREVQRWQSVDVRIAPRSIHDFVLRERRPVDVSMRPGKLVAETGLALIDVADVCARMVETRFQGRSRATAGF